MTYLLVALLISLYLYIQIKYNSTFFTLFMSLGFSEVNRSGYFRISGCGVDMIFHTNYTIIHNLRSLGFISKKECSHLAQQTPNII